jgi:hypothetical protein
LGILTQDYPPSAEDLDEDVLRLRGVAGRPSAAHVWCFWWPARNEFTYAKGDLYERAVVRAVKRFKDHFFPNNALSRGLQPEHLVLVKTNNPAYLTEFNGILYSKIITPKIARKTLELLMGKRNDWVPGPEKYDQYYGYCAYQTEVKNKFPEIVWEVDIHDVPPTEPGRAR